MMTYKSLGPTMFAVSTKFCRSLEDIRYLWRMSYRTYCNSAAAVLKSPEQAIRIADREGIRNPHEYASRLAEIMRKDSAWVAIDIAHINNKRDVNKTLRMSCKYSGDSVVYVERAIAYARKYERNGGVIDDYAAFMCWAISFIVNGGK